MKKIVDYIVHHAILCITIFLVLLIPCMYGFWNTEVNYDILSYLPENIETLKGEEILTKDFGIGAYAFVLTNEKNNQNLLHLEEAIKKIESVNDVFSIANFTDHSIPIEMLPDDILHKLYQNDETVFLVTFQDGISSQATMKAVEKMRELTNDASRISGMTALILDTKQLSEKESILYILFAVLFCFLVLLFVTDSYFIPVLLIGNIGVAILINMGTNLFLGSISYITQSITAVLQLGVTMDFSIFLYHKYMEQKKDEKNKKKAMQQAILETIKSVVGSSLTTIAGFLALCGMKLTLGLDIGLVMAKGVVCGLLTVFTLFPALLLVFDKQIEKTKHKNHLPHFEFLHRFILNHYKGIAVCLLLLFIPAIIGNHHVQVYYKIDESLPDDLPSKIANQSLASQFHIVSPEIIILDSTLPVSQKQNLFKELEELDGVDLILSLDSLENKGIPIDILPENILTKIQQGQKELVLVNSTYEVASNALNHQITLMNEIVKKYDHQAIVAGEGALTKDLVEIADHDFQVVNYISIGMIFILMIFVLKSISLPFILILVIELAIFLNMAWAYFSHTSLPFIASIVVGTIQLGATIDYAILLSTTYLQQRSKSNKKEAMKETLSSTLPSIFVSACCLFAATCGVSMISKIDMIAAICKLLSRGSLISMVIVSLLLPALLLLLDTLIQKTTLKKKEGK